ncbi:MAG: APC family permease [Bacteroidia bacterium]|nr:APC family permease [Bacteroidia bacterium]
MSTSPHKLGFFSVTMIVISLVIGTGIFKTPASIAASAGTPLIFYATWILGGLIALCGALTYAEIGSRLPVMGAYYKVFAYCYHPLVGFTVNALILVSNAASLAIVALIGADYVSDLLFGQPSGTAFNVLVAILAVTLFYGVNLLGLKTSSRTQNILTLIKIGLVILLISSVFTGVQVAPHGYNPGRVLEYTGSNGWLLLMLSLIPVSFTYGGYQQTINFGSEVKSGRTLPQGIIVGILVVLGLYLSISFAYVKVIGFEEIKNASAIGALLFEAWFGPVGAKVFDVAMFLSVLAYVNIILMSNPRVMYAMAEDQVFPALFKLTNRQGVLVSALTVYAAVTVVIIFLGKGVDNVLGFVMFLDSIGMGASAATLFILRRQQVGQDQVQGAWTRFTPLLAGIFVCAYAVVAIAVVIQNPAAAGIGTGLMALFAGVYWGLYHRRAGGENAA